MKAEPNEIRGKILDIIDQDNTIENSVIILRGLIIGIDDIVDGSGMILEADAENRTNMIRIRQFMRYLSLILSYTTDELEKNTLEIEKQIMKILS